jgi:hypothetical protein
VSCQLPRYLQPLRAVEVVILHRRGRRLRLAQSMAFTRSASSMGLGCSSESVNCWL